MTLYMKELGFRYADKISLTERLDIAAEQTPISMSGFYGFENDFSWTKPLVEVTLRNKQIAKSGLEMELRIPDQVADLSPELRVTINGLPASKMRTVPGGLTLYYPPEEISSFDDTYDIRLEHDFSFVPAELGENDDTRELSLQVMYIGDKR